MMIEPRRLARCAVVVLALARLAAALDVPLTVRETEGVARRREPCRTGVPLPPGAVSDSGKLAVLGPDGRAVPAQFRVMNRRAKGDIEWVCVDFLADVPAKGSVQYRLTDVQAPGKLAQPVSVARSAKAIVVSTGPLRAAIPTALFSGLGVLWLDANGDGEFAADEVVAKGGALVVEGIDGRVYRSAAAGDLAGPLQVELEESGPLHVVVRIDGSLKAQSADGKRHTYPVRTLEGGTIKVHRDLEMANADETLGFTVRHHFWAGQSWVRTFVTLRNLAGKSHTKTDGRYRWNAYFVDTVQEKGNFLVDGVSLELALAATGPLKYRLGGGVEGSEVHAGRLAAEQDGVTLFQSTAAGWLWQAGSGKIFDPVLKAHVQWMKAQGNDKPYFEYAPLWYDQLNQQRDGESFMGYRVYRGHKTSTPGSRTSDKELGKHAAEGMRAPGWVEVDDGRFTVTVGCRWFWQLCPKDLRVTSDGRVSVGLWSKHRDRGHVFEGRFHKTHELLFDFRASGKGTPAEQRFAAFDARLMAVADARYYLATGAFREFMLPNPKEWPRFENYSMTAVVTGLDTTLPPAFDSSFTVEREKYDHYGVWDFGDHAKGGYHYFSQYLELDVPQCLMVTFARTGDLRVYREAEIACRQLLDVPAHGGGYGHQKGESSHFYTTGPLMFSYLTGEPWLKQAVLASYKHANPNVWHLRSFGITVWSSLDILRHFPEAEHAVARDKIRRSLAWWRSHQKDMATGRLEGYTKKEWQAFYLGICGDAMGRYCEAFPDDGDARRRLVAAVDEWSRWAMQQEPKVRTGLLVVCPANAFAYATRFSGDAKYLDFAAKHLAPDSHFSGKFRVGTSSGKGWSEYGLSLTEVFLHDVDKRRHPERYPGLR